MRGRWDWPLFLIILALGSISLLVIFSIDKGLFRNQLIFWVIGLAVFWIFSNLDWRFWAGKSYFFYAATLIFLLTLLFIGDSVRGSTRWINLGFFRFQPSEIAKMAAILMLADFLRMRSAAVFKNIFVSFMMILPAVVLVLIQPDIGNTLAFFALWFGMCFVGGFPKKYLLLMLILAAVSSIFLYEVLAPYQRGRITSFIHPGSDPLGTGYNIIQSKIAVGSGNLAGRGLGRGPQSQLKFLPEAESDFIFASVAEALGLLGASLVIILFCAMIGRMLGLIKHADRFGQFVIAGTVFYLAMQFLVNVGMNIGIFPITGITLPLVSYGGSSLISTLFILGVVFATAKRGY